jgi:hypothetical protein
VIYLRRHEVTHRTDVAGDVTLCRLELNERHAKGWPGLD